MLQPLFEVRRYRGDVVTHSHDFHQVVLPLEGRLSMIVGGTEGYVSTHSVALVAAGESHSFTGSKSNAFLVIDIPTRSWVAADELGALLWERARHHPFVPVDTELLRLIRYLARASERGQLRGPFITHACSLLLGTVSAQLGLHRASQLLAHTSLSVMEVALRVGYGDQAAFTRAFRKHTGRAPLNYRAAVSSQQDGHKSQ